VNSSDNKLQPLLKVLPFTITVNKLQGQMFKKTRIPYFHQCLATDSYTLPYSKQSIA